MFQNTICLPPPVFTQLVKSRWSIMGVGRDHVLAGCVDSFSKWSNSQQPDRIVWVAVGVCKAQPASQPSKQDGEMFGECLFVNQIHFHHPGAAAAVKVQQQRSNMMENYYRLKYIQWCWSWIILEESGFCKKKKYKEIEHTVQQSLEKSQI